MSVHKIYNIEVNEIIDDFNNQSIYSLHAYKYDDLIYTDCGDDIEELIEKLSNSGRLPSAEYIRSEIADGLSETIESQKQTQDALIKKNLEMAKMAYCLITDIDNLQRDGYTVRELQSFKKLKQILSEKIY